MCRQIFGVTWLGKAQHWQLVEVGSNKNDYNESVESGKALASTLTARGSRTPYAWSITQGGLPAGLTLNPATGAITGIPTASGTVTFTVQVSDATPAPNGRTASGTYSIQIP